MMNHFPSSSFQIIPWLLISYLLVVAGFYFDGWYHAVVGRDEFWIPPHFFVMLGQIIHTGLSWLLFQKWRGFKGEWSVYAKRYLFLQLLFFIGFAFDESWHRVIGEETIDTPLVFWGPPHIVIALSLLLTPFFLAPLISSFIKDNGKVLLLTLNFGGLAAFISFYMQPLWPLGPFHVIDFWGEIPMMILLGTAFGLGCGFIKSKFALAAQSLVFLAFAEIMSWGKFADIAGFHHLFDVPAYPYWMFFFSFFLSALICEALLSFRMLRLWQLGALWGGFQAMLFYTAAKVWVDYSPLSLFEGWRYFPGVFLSWSDIALLVSGGALGGALGFGFALFLCRSIFNLYMDENTSEE